MTISTVSNMSIQTSLVTYLQAEQSSLTTLTAQLATGKVNGNLTDYSASDARNLISLQSTATQKQSYLNVISTVSNNLSIYNTTLTDLESIAQQAQTLASNNQTYNANTADDINAEATSYLNSVTADLNQSVNGRYIYSGTRYDTQPVQNLSTLPSSTLSSTTTTSPAVPSYDSLASLTATADTSAETVTIDGTPQAGQTASMNVNGNTYTYDVQSTDTASSVASALAALATTGGDACTSSGGVISATSPNSIVSASVAADSTAAYTTDQATIDTGYTVNYGISSNDPSFQTLISGLRYLQAAAQATDSATYQSDMSQASSLLTSATSSLQTLNTSVANNINVMTNEKAKQNTALSNLTDQVDDISQVDTTQVSAEITAMQTILQASYLVTGDIEKLSIVSYL